MNKKILLILMSVSFLNAEPLKFQKRNDLNKEYYDLASKNLENLKEKMNYILNKTPENEQMELCLGTQEDIQKDFNKNLKEKNFVKRVGLNAVNDNNKVNKIDKKIIKGFEDFKQKKVLFLGNWNKYILYTPIRLKNDCLRCHGEDINKKDESLMKSIYKKGEFKQNYKEGDLIGVWKSEVSKGY